MASGEDPRDTLKRIHPKDCGTPNGYQQISRARKALREAGVVAADLPEYDEACKAAWREYFKHRRHFGGRLYLPMGPAPIQDAEHGTVQRFRIHVKQRRALRAEGVPEEELPPICKKCRDAWRIYNRDLKARRGTGVPRAEPGTVTVEIPSPWSSCGTPEGVREHRRERRRQREAGQAPSPICDKCQAEILRGNVLRRINKVRARKRS